MRILVTGGAGFIGSHSVDALMAEGYSVTVLDDLSSGKMKNLETHLKNPAFRFIRGDIRNPKSVERALAGADAVIHEAAFANVPLSIRDPALARSVNVEGTTELLRSSLRQGIDRLVYTSSCAVYGEQTKFPISEGAEPKPLSPYASSKLEAEQKCLAFLDQKKLETICLRYFNVYGPRQTTGEYAGVIVGFTERLRRGMPPVIYGDGEQTRDFIHISDAVGATLRALERSGVAGQVINIGSGVETSINRLCQIFLEASGKTYLKPLHDGARPGDIRRSQADISKARKLLGYGPRVTLEAGVGDLLASFKSA